MSQAAEFIQFLRATCKLRGSVFYRTGYCRAKIAGIGIFDLFCSCDPELDLMTFIYKLDLYSLEI